MISEGPLEDIAATRIKALMPHHAGQVGGYGAVWGEARVLSALGPESRIIELIQLPQKTGSTS